MTFSLREQTARISLIKFAQNIQQRNWKAVVQSNNLLPSNQQTDRDSMLTQFLLRFAFSADFRISTPRRCKQVFCVSTFDFKRRMRLLQSCFSLLVRCINSTEMNSESEAIMQQSGAQFWFICSTSNPLHNRRCNHRQDDYSIDINHETDEDINKS